MRGTTTSLLPVVTDMGYVRQQVGRKKIADLMPDAAAADDLPRLNTPPATCNRTAPAPTTSGWGRLALDLPGTGHCPLLRELREG